MLIEGTFKCWYRQQTKYVPTYDGTPVTSGLSGGVPSKIKEIDPAAKFYSVLCP